MKAWFEFPESTRYARRSNDILYTPIYFANEAIEATFRLDDEWQREYPLLQGLTAQITLTGRASLGFLSIGGRPASGFDHRYALPSVGFRPIYSLDLMELQQTLRLDDRYYDRENDTDNHLRDSHMNRTNPTADNGSRTENNGVANTDNANNPDTTDSTATLTEQEQREVAQRLQPGHRHPFSFNLPTSTLHEIQQIASSLKVITADARSTMSFLKETSPALIVGVSYLLTGEVYHQEIRKKADTNQEIRIFVGMTEDQAPRITSEVITRNPMAALVERQIVAVGGKKSSSGGGGRRRSSIPFLRRRSSAAATSNTTSSLTGGGLDDAYVIVEAAVPKPFTFRRQDDAAATKLVVTLTYHGGDENIPPPTMTGEATWMLKTLTTLTLEPVDRAGSIETEDDYFHLRAKILPSRKHKLKWDTWSKTNGNNNNTQPQDPTSQSQPGPPSHYTSKTEIWLTQPATATLSPSFTTPFLSHLYILHMSLTIITPSSSSSSESSLKKSLPSFVSSSGNKQTIELSIPVQVRYDLGFAPSYSVDETLPEYDYTLPRYSDEIVGGRSGGDGGGAVGEGIEGGGGLADVGEGVEGVIGLEGENPDEHDDEVMAALVRRAIRIEENRLARTTSTT